MALFHMPRDRIRDSNTKYSEYTDVEIVEKYDCFICDTEYDSETELHLHKKAKHKNAVLKLLAHENTCQVCIRAHESSEDLLKHMKTAHFLSSEDAEFVERELFVCDFCHLIYFNKQMLVLHLLHAHYPEKKETSRANCPKCNKNIKVKQTWFHFHRHQIHSITCCPLCFKKCKNSRHLMEHVKEHPSYYYCTLCQYYGKNLETFKMHMKSHKKGYLSFTDSVVKRCFIPKHYARKTTYNFGLNGLASHSVIICILCRAICDVDSAPDHMRMHLVENSAKKEYACVCGEKFFNSVLLKHHIFKFKGDHAPDTQSDLNVGGIVSKQDSEMSIPEESMTDNIDHVNITVSSDHDILIKVDMNM